MDFEPDLDNFLILLSSPIESGYDSGSVTETDSSPSWRPDASEYYNSCGQEIAPNLEVTVQPQRYYRFRYLTEFKDNPHGPLLGENSPKTNRIFPTVKLNNYAEKAIIRCWLMDSSSKQVHIHQLLTKNDGKGIRSEPHDCIVDVKNDFTAPFEGLNIIHAVTKQKDYLQSFHRKKCHFKSGFDLKKDKLPYDEISLKEEVKKLEKNKAVLYFEAFDFKTKEKLCDRYSWEIKNSKNPKTSSLKIGRRSIDCGSVNGGTEVYIFVEKVSKNVKVVFSDDNQWSAEAEIEEIWHQVAIAFRAPAYPDPFITEKKKVSFKLIRESDGSFSNEMNFYYLPDYKFLNDYYEPVVTGKKRRIDDVSIIKMETLPITFECSESFATTATTYDYQDQILKQDNPLINAWNNDDQIILSDTDNLVTSSSYILTENSSDMSPINLEEIKVPDYIDCDSAGVDSNEIQSVPNTCQDSIAKDVNVTPQTSDSYSCAKNLFKMMISTNGDINVIKFEETIRKTESFNLNVKDLKNSYNKTLLHMAIENKKTEYVKPILLSGVDIDAADIDRNAALHLAVMHNIDDYVLTLLLSKGAKTTICNNAGETPMHLACRLGRTSALHCLLLYMDTDFEYHSIKNGDTPLHVAVRYRHIELIRSLLEKFPVYSLNYACLTPLHIAVSQENEGVINLMLSHMDPDEKKNVYLVNVLMTRTCSDLIFKLLEDYMNKNGIKTADFNSYDLDFSTNLSSVFSTKCKLEESRS